MRALCPRLRRRPRGERGSMAVEVVILAPVLMAFVLLIVAFGRYVAVKGDIEATSRDAVRAASMAASAGEARQAAAQVVASSLEGSTTCGAPAVGGTWGPGGEVSVSLNCRVSYAGLGLIGCRAAWRSARRASALLDPYRRYGDHPAPPRQRWHRLGLRGRDGRDLLAVAGLVVRRGQRAERARMKLADDTEQAGPGRGPQQIDETGPALDRTGPARPDGRPARRPASTSAGSGYRNAGVAARERQLGDGRGERQPPTRSFSVSSVSTPSASGPKPQRKRSTTSDQDPARPDPQLRGPERFTRSAGAGKASSLGRALLAAVALLVLLVGVPSRAVALHRPAADPDGTAGSWGPDPAGRGGDRAHGAACARLAGLAAVRRLHRRGVRQLRARRRAAAGRSAVGPSQAVARALVGTLLVGTSFLASTVLPLRWLPPRRLPRPSRRWPPVTTSWTTRRRRRTTRPARVRSPSHRWCRWRVFRPT